MAGTQVSVPASWYFRMAACRALIRVLARTTPGRSGATLDSNDRHYPDHRRVRGCHSYKSPDSAGRPAHAGAGRWSRCSARTLEIPTSSVRSNCSAGHGGLVVPGHPHEWVTESGNARPRSATSNCADQAPIPVKSGIAAGNAGKLQRSSAATSCPATQASLSSPCVG